MEAGGDRDRGKRPLMGAAAIRLDRACTELLRQAAQKAGLLSASDEQSADGLISEEAATAIDIDDQFRVLKLLGNDRAGRRDGRLAADRLGHRRALLPGAP